MRALLAMAALSLTVLIVAPAGSAAAGPPGPALPAGRADDRWAVARTHAPGARFQLPVPAPPVVLTPFRPPAERWGAGHRGVDLGAAVGTPVRAAGAGVVAYAGMLAGRFVVSVRHTDTLRTTYEPVRPSVSVGDLVAAGDVIGTVEAGHPSCRPASCLHWGARIGADHYIDPLTLLRDRRVRLKPWAG